MLCKICWAANHIEDTIRKNRLMEVIIINNRCFSKGINKIAIVIVIMLM